MTELLSRIREVVEGPQPQGANESIAYTIDISPWGDTPTDITVVVTDQAGADVTDDVTTGSASAVDSTHIKLPYIHSLIGGTQYTVNVTFVSDGGPTFNPYFIILAEA